MYGEKDADGFYWGEFRGRRGYVPHNMVVEVQVGLFTLSLFITSIYLLNTLRTLWLLLSKYLHYWFKRVYIN